MIKVGILRLYIGNSGKVGYYNVQEIGLAKSLAKQEVEAYVFLLDISKHEIEIESIEHNVKIVIIPAKKIGSHGIFDLEILKDFNLNVIHVISDTQLYAGKTISWCLKNNIKVLTHFGTVESSSPSRFAKLLAKFVC